MLLVSLVTAVAGGAGLRPDLRDDQGRAGEFDLAPDLLHLPAGVPVQRVRLCRRRWRRSSSCCCCSSRVVMFLMTRGGRFQLCLSALRRYRYTPGQTAIVRLVWMLVGAVLAAMTLFPLLWMVSIAFKTQSEMFDMRLIPATPTLGNFPYVFTAGRFPALSVQHLLRRGHGDGRRRSSSTRWPAMRWRGCAFPGARRSSSTMFSTFLVSLPVIIVPLFILVRALGHAEHLCRADHPGDLQRLRHLPAAPVLPLGPARARGGGADRRRRLTGASTGASSCRSAGRSCRRSRSSSSSPTGTRSSGR